MGLLTDTIADALRPVPGAGGMVRRAHRGMVPASADAAALPDEDPGALTVYRLQKDGGHLPPRAPSAKPVTAERGPSSSSRGPASVGADGAVSVPKPSNQRNLPSGRWRNESKRSELQFAAGLSTTSNVPFRQIPSHESVDMSQAPDLPFDSSHVRNSESGTSGQTEGTDEWRGEARGAPSEDLPIAATAPSQAGEGVPHLPAADVARRIDADMDGAAPPAADVPAASVPHERALARAQALRTASAHAPGMPRDAGARLAASAPAVAASRPDAEPRVRIGRIDVVVLAPPAPAPAPPAVAAGPARDFLSRNYLRRT